MKSRKNCVKKNVPGYGQTMDECVDIVLKKALGDKLGQGEQGTVYALGEYVIKVTSLLKKGMEDIWFDEVCKAQDLGELKIAPTIHRHFICNKLGFIVMNRLTPMKSMIVTNKKNAILQMKKNKDVIRYKWKNGNVYDFMDNISLLSQDTQIKFIQLLETMIENGYIHMDNHIDNLGYDSTTKQPIAYDFGFTQYREDMEDSKDDMEWALCFTMFQILEHCPLNQIEKTLFYRVATSIINKTYKWSDAKSGKVIPLSVLPKVIDKTEKEEKKEPIDFLKFITDSKKIKHLKYPDVFVGSLCYAKIITQEKDDRDDTYLDFIYLVRNPNNLKDADKAVIQIFKKLY